MPHQFIDEGIYNNMSWSMHLILFISLVGCHKKYIHSNYKYTLADMENTDREWCPRSTLWVPGLTCSDINMLLDSNNSWFNKCNYKIDRFDRKLCWHEGNR